MWQVSPPSSFSHMCEHERSHHSHPTSYTCHFHKPSTFYTWLSKSTYLLHVIEMSLSWVFPCAHLPFHLTYPCDTCHKAKPPNLSPYSTQSQPSIYLWILALDFPHEKSINLGLFSHFHHLFICYPYNVHFITQSSLSCHHVAGSMSNHIQPIINISSYLSFEVCICLFE